MINYIQSIDETPACECGAALEEGHLLCRKCRARDRWMRRHGARRKATRRPGESRRPANRPRGIVEAGVSWT
ncbi:hypothetical protein SAMN05216276_108436 [Streptosporangium subroseum]|uniref:Uncharacterized protein n=1 Tax=Streptosporangium subroseum TaxID=106412 RepID=A0A239P3D1_9ACTN|nr:hypothetical protein [Streptosporangium subroseum]SNT61596.1 hypothetical protein SAMN05216276_108436 [Streptosporangium subroseum]